MNRNIVQIRCINCNINYHIDIKRLNLIKCQCGTNTRLVKCYSCGGLLKASENHKNLKCGCGNLIEYVEEYIPEKSPCRIKHGYVGRYNKMRGRLRWMK